MPQKTKEEDVRKIVGDRGYILLDIYTVKKHIKRIVFKDKYGYKYDNRLADFINIKNKIRIVSKYNPFSMENILIWIKRNRDNFEIQENSFYLSSISNTIKIKHTICNDIFSTSWGKIIAGVGCGVCHGKQIGKSNSLENSKKLMKFWNPINSIPPNRISKSSTEDVYWICPDCLYGKNGEWKTSPNKKGYGCPACSNKIVSDKNRLSILYPELSLEWHPIKNGKLTPDDVSYASHKKVWWVCSKGHEHVSVIASRTSGNNCPKCKASKGEMKISKFLYNNGIKNISQYIFGNCRNILPLPFDFYLPDWNLCIEYHGKQHYEKFKNNFFGDMKKFRERQKRDKIKSDYCFQNNINLLIIPYWDFDNIEQILTETLL